MEETQFIEMNHNLKGSLKDVIVVVPLPNSFPLL